MQHLKWMTVAALLLFAGCCKHCDKKKDTVKQAYLHKYGVALTASEWSARGGDGQIITTKKSGVVVTEQYEDGKLHGECTETFPYSEIVAQSRTYDKGKLIAEKSFSFSGIPLREVRYPAPNQRVELQWYEEGNTPQSTEYYNNDLLTKGDYLTPANEVESRVENSQGIRTMRDTQGNLLYRDTIADGALVIRTTFLRDGAPETVTPYLEGKVHGVKKTFLPGGLPSSFENWEKGKKNGLTTLFINGEKSSEIPYSKGTKEGIERRFRNGEEVVEEIAWKNNKRHGIARFFVDGTENIEWYFNGDKVSEGYFRTHSFDARSTPSEAQ